MENLEESKTPVEPISVTKVDVPPSTNSVPESVSNRLELTNRETEREKQELQDAYVKQLKENNKVLKDLMKNKNKEVISLELQIKKDKMDFRKELQGLKKKVQSLEGQIKQYQEFTHDLAKDFMDIAVPTVKEDLEIIDDCLFLNFSADKWLKIIETTQNKFSKFSQLFKDDKVIPYGFEDAISQIKTSIQDINEGEGEGEDPYLEEMEDDQEEMDEEQQDEANVFDQVQNTDPIHSKPKA